MLRSTFATTRARRALGTLSFASLLGAVPVHAPRHAAPAGAPSLELRHVTVVDLERGRLLTNRNVVIDGNRIVSMRLGGAATSGARVVDATGKYLIPGLWDMHVHVTTSPESTIALGRRAREVFFPQYLAAGVTGLRDMAGWLDTITALRREVRDGVILGPRLVIAGRLLGGKNPYMPGAPHAWVVSTPEEVTAAVDSLKLAGADFIKVHDMLRPDVFFAAAKAAREAGLPLVGHLRPSVPVAAAVAAGQVGLEHVPIELAAACTPNDTANANAFYGAWIAKGWTEFVRGTADLWAEREPARCEAVFKLLHDAGVRLDPTMVLRMQDRAWSRGINRDALTTGNAAICDATVKDWGGTSDSVRATYYRTIFDIVGTAHRAGIHLLAGTDGPGGCLAPGSSLLAELDMMTRAGLTPLEALRTATSEPARFLGLADSLGTVAVGFVADLVLLDASPLTSLATLANPAGVVANGRWMDRAALKAMRERASRIARGLQPKESSIHDAAPAAAAPTPANALSGPTYAITHGRWLLNGHFEQRTRWSVNGTITDRAPARVDSTIDLANGWVVPPFGDAHTHNLDGPFNIDSVRASYVREGTMYVQVLTNSRTGAERVRARWGRPCELDVAYANGGLTSTLSHPFLAYEPRAMGIRTDWAAHAAEIRRSRVAENNSYFFLDSLGDVGRKWAAIMDGHPDVLKIFLLDAMEEPPVPSDTGLPTGHGLKPSLVREIVRRAHAAGLRVAAHVETANDVRVAVRAGVDMLAHLPAYEMPRGEDVSRYLIDEETAKLAGAQGLVVAPTLSLATVVADSADESLTAERRRVQDRNIRLLRRHGAHIVVGSDWFGRTASGEFRALAASGIWSPSELLRIWSEETPRSIFPRRRIGRLDEGYEASFIVFTTDPTRTFALPAITMRVKQGCIMTP